MSTATMITAGLTALGGLGATEVVLPRHQTRVREEALEIRSVAADVAAPMTLVEPGTNLRGQGQLAVRYDLERLYREEVTPREARDEAWQHAATVRLRLRLARDWSTELAGRVLVSNAYDGADLASVDSLAVYQLYEDRYGGVNVVAGAGWPVGSGKALGEGGDVEELRPNYVLGLRGTGHWWFNVLHLNLTLRYADGVVYRTDVARLDEAGEGIPAGDWTGNRLRLTGALGATWRPAWWYRLGVEGQVTADWYDGDEEGQDLTDRRFRVQLFQEFTFSPQLSAQLSLGVDPDTLHALDGDALTGSAGLLVRF